MQQLKDRIEEDFRANETSSEGVQQMAIVRKLYLTLARALVSTMPEGRELHLALTKLEEAMFWSNAGISRHGQS